MSEPIFRLFSGDPYRCERALADREAALRAADPEMERHVHFADEVQSGSLELDLTSLSLFALGRHFVVRRVEKAKPPKSFVPLLESSFAQGTYLTMIATDLRATHPIAKAAKARDAWIALAAPRGNAVRGSAKEILAERGVTLTGPAFQELLRRCGNNLLTISQEAGKLQSVGSERPIEPQLIERTVFPSAEQTVYPFYDRLGEANLSATLAELRTLQEDPGLIVNGILRHLTRLTMIRVLLDRKVARSQMAASIGVQDWLLRRLVGQAQQRPLDQLTATLRRGIQLDYEIKSGQTRPADALMSLVLEAVGTRSTRPSPQRVPG